MPEEPGVLIWQDILGESTDNVFRGKAQEMAGSPTAFLLTLGGWRDGRGVLPPLAMAEGTASADLLCCQHHIM